MVSTDLFEEKISSQHVSLFFLVKAECSRLETEREKLQLKADCLQTQLEASELSLKQTQQDFQQERTNSDIKHK